MYQAIGKIICYHRCGYKYYLGVFICLYMLLSQSLLANIDVPIVFVSRNHQSGGNINYPTAGLLPGMGPFSRFKVVGGKLLIRQASGSIETLVDSTINFNG